MVLVGGGEGGEGFWRVEGERWRVKGKRFGEDACACIRPFSLSPPLNK